MPESDLLFTMAEVSVAFAGFASIVGVLGRRASRDDPRLDAIRMRAMVFHSLLVVVFSLTPVALSSWGFSEEAVWRISSAAFAIAGLVTSVHIARRALAIRAAGVPTRGRVVGLLALGLPLAVGFVLALNALGFWNAVAAFYQTSLVLYLFVAGFAFGLIILSFLGGDKPEAT